MPGIDIDDLRRLALEEGLSVVAVSEATALEQDRGFLERWQSAGYGAQMEYMQRDSGLLSDPRRLLAEAKSVISVGAFYDRGERVPLTPGYGRVARYAWGRDYHKVLRVRLDNLCLRIRKYLGREVNFRVFSDSVPLLERALAKRAGIGFVGKNTMLIIPRAGSFMFLGEVVCDLTIDGVSEQVNESERNCGACTQCLNSCPTGAFVSEYTLDAGRCISYLTIEKRDSLSWEERSLLGEWLFGCDICQDVCPFNVISIKSRAKPDLPEFDASQGAGQQIELESVLALRDHASFVARFAGTPIMRARREGLLRNAACVAVNTASVNLLPSLRDASLGDESPMVRQHAVWAVHSLAWLAGEIKRGENEKALSHALNDPSEIVRAEALRCKNA